MRFSIGLVMQKISLGRWSKFNRSDAEPSQGFKGPQSYYKNGGPFLKKYDSSPFSFYSESEKNKLECVWI